MSLWLLWTLGLEFEPKRGCSGLSEFISALKAARLRSFCRFAKGRLTRVGNAESSLCFWKSSNAVSPLRALVARSVANQI